jgi:hypothetical protein
LLKSAIAAEIAVFFKATAGHITDFVTWTGALSGNSGTD